MLQYLPLSDQSRSVQKVVRTDPVSEIVVLITQDRAAASLETVHAHAVNARIIWGDELHTDVARVPLRLT